MATRHFRPRPRRTLVNEHKWVSDQALFFGHHAIPFVDISTLPPRPHTRMHTPLGHWQDVAVSGASSKFAGTGGVLAVGCRSHTQYTPPCCRAARVPSSPAVGLSLGLPESLPMRGAQPDSRGSKQASNTVALGQLQQSGCGCGCGCGFVVVVMVVAGFVVGVVVGVRVGVGGGVRGGVGVGVGLGFGLGLWLLRTPPRRPVPLGRRAASPRSTPRSNARTARISSLSLSRRRRPAGHPRRHRPAPPRPHLARDGCDAR